LFKLQEISEHPLTGIPGNFSEVGEDTVAFGHLLTVLLGDQLEAGLVIMDMYEDVMNDSPLAKYHSGYIVM